MMPDSPAFLVGTTQRLATERRFVLKLDTWPGIMSKDGSKRFFNVFSRQLLGGTILTMPYWHATWEISSMYLGAPKCRSGRG